MTTQTNGASPWSRTRTLKKLKTDISNYDDELYDEEEHYYDEIDVLVEHVDQDILKRKIAQELKSSMQRSNSQMANRQQQHRRTR